MVEQVSIMSSFVFLKKKKKKSETEYSFPITISQKPRLTREES